MLIKEIFKITRLRVLVGVASMLALTLGWLMLISQPKVQISISTDKSVYRSGETIDLTVKWKNIYFRRVNFDVTKGGGLEDDYRPIIKWNGYSQIHSIRSQKPRVKWSGEGSDIIRSPEPGTEIEDTFRVNDEYDMSRKGKYTIKARWYDEDGKDWITSNEIEVRVESDPPSLHLNDIGRETQTELPSKK